MMTKALRRLLQLYGPWRLVQVILMALIVCLGVGLVMVLVTPTTADPQVELAVQGRSRSGANRGHLSAVAQPANDANELVIEIRPGLFRSVAPLRDKPRADKNVEQVLSQLKLQMVLEVRGKPVAYIHVKNEGLKICQIGDSVDDLFQVVNIDIASQMIEIQIADQKETLRL